MPHWHYCITAKRVRQECAALKNNLAGKKSTLLCIFFCEKYPNMHVINTEWDTHYSCRTFVNIGAPGTLAFIFTVKPYACTSVATKPSIHLGISILAHRISLAPRDSNTACAEGSAKNHVTSRQQGSCFWRRADDRFKSVKCISNTDPQNMLSKVPRGSMHHLLRTLLL